MRSGQIAAGTGQHNQLVNTQYGTMKAASLAAGWPCGADRGVRRGQRADHGGGFAPGQEFGTLKALGWRSRRIVGQVIGESFVIGVRGAVLGVGLGYGGTA